MCAPIRNECDVNSPRRGPYVQKVKDPRHCDRERAGLPVRRFPGYSEKAHVSTPNCAPSQEHVDGRRRVSVAMLGEGLLATRLAALPNTRAGVSSCVINPYVVR